MKKAIYNKAKRVRDFSFSRYFNPHKSPNTLMGYKRPKGIVVWPSARKGTYVRAIHGVLNPKRPR